MKVGERNLLRERWTAETTRAGNALVAGQGVNLPYGKTEAGLVDLRGLQLDARRLVGLTLGKLDLGASQTAGVVFAECHIGESSFDFTDVPWADQKSSFSTCSFRGAKLHPGGFGRSTFTACDFEQADLSKLNCNRPRFERCSFVGTKFDGSEMGGSTFDACGFMGTIKRCTFSGTGGGFFRCDLSRVAFLECDFKMMRMEDCTLAPEQLWFQDWPAALTRLEATLGNVTDDAIRSLLSAWRRQVDWHPTHLIDLRSIRRKYQPGAAGALELALRDVLR